jgi:divalent metal cation (Fe/Co/Zn/Cd) transporter
VGRSLPAEQLQKLEAIVAGSPAVAEILTLWAVYIALEEAIVAAKIHPDEALTIDQLAQAMDGLDLAIRSALPEVADVFLNVTTYRLDTLPLGQQQGYAQRASD